MKIKMKYIANFLKQTQATIFPVISSLIHRPA